MRKITDGRLSRQAQENDPVKELSSAQRAALNVAKQYPVFPCHPGTKRPLVEHGFKDATRDATIVAQWWQRYPEALIGVPTGTASGLVAIDVDPEGLHWYRGVRDRLGVHRLHGTRRGKHLLYLMGSTEVRNSTSVISNGIDVRGEGGYVIWWPAHGGVSVGEPGELPGWLERAAGVGKQSGARKVECGEDTPSRDTRKFKDGTRGVALSNRAYHYRKMGLSTTELGVALLQYDLEHCDPPYQQTNGKSAVLYIARKKGHILTDDEKAINQEVISRTMAEVPEEAVDWLWKGFLARNKVHIIAGAGATMKSTLTLAMAATITRGGTWPDDTKCPRGNVIIWTGEDDLGDTVKPRFRWAGGDQDKCTVLDGVTGEGIERAFDPAQDLGLLDRECTRVGGVALIIIDPIVVIVQKDNNSVNDVRRALFPLKKLAEKHNCVILGIQHFNKGSKGKDPVERITGSGGWSQAPRIVLATAPIVDGEGKDPTKYVFACIKTFAKKQKGGYEYGFEEEPKTEIARTVWGKHLDGTGHAILTEAEGGEDGESKLGAAKKFLRELLGKGPVAGFEVKKRYEEAGITRTTFKRAKDDLKVKPVRVGKNQFRWYLPDEVSDNSEEDN